MTQTYDQFLASKHHHDVGSGISDGIVLPDVMLPHQADITRWALRRGRAALFEATGLGKTIQELAWAQNVSSHTERPVLIFAPLAVSEQHIDEGRKFGIPAKLVAEQSDCIVGVNVTNYQKMDHFDFSKFSGVVLDESSSLKSTTSVYRAKLTELCSQIPFRLAATATPAPNDYMELGNHAEFLGVCSYTDMLTRFFVHDGGETQQWRLKGWAEDRFWQWMASWSVMIRKPSDLGYPNDGYDLPPLNYHTHIAEADYSPDIETGTLFPMEAHTMQERLAARRGSVDDRVRLAAEITPNDRPFMWWCHLNAESDALERAISGAVNLQGSDSDDDKRAKLVGFKNGSIRVLISKPLIAGFGLNFQHCADTGFVGLNDSFEQLYQAVRRFWRFGQTKPVNVHLISAETEGAIVQNIRRKEADAEHMADQMIAHMADISNAEIHGMVRDVSSYEPEETMEIPSWLRGIK